MANLICGDPQQTAPSDFYSRVWDVVIIGTGVGGGTVGRRLAEKGLSVLFLERGPAGHRSEQHGLSDAIQHPASRHTRGFWPTPVPLTIDGRREALSACLGAGVGGTSVFYAAAFERPERHDLEDSPSRPHPTGGWPIKFDDFSHYCAEAERVFEVNGGEDPLSTEAPLRLREPPDLSPGDHSLFEKMVQAGLNPYRLRNAIKYVPDCMECIGRKCPRDCKMDGRSAGVEPALRSGNAALVHDFKVERLEGGGSRISAVVGRHSGELRAVSGRIIVLSAGGLGSAALLLASGSQDWPTGCSNSSGLVGRGLMFHLHDLVAIWPPRAMPLGKPVKNISLRDFYFMDGKRFGIFQSLGLSASYGHILHALRQRLDRGPARRVPFISELAIVPALAASQLLGSARIFSGMIEDLPYDNNRVSLGRPNDQDSLTLTYSLSPELIQRCRDYRRLRAKRLSRLRTMVLTPEPALNYGHPCGTLRFGTDARRSVLDPDCRSHDIENLYCVDSAFMPTSTGVNPSIIIAANALRVGDRIAERLSRLGA